MVQDILIRHIRQHAKVIPIKDILYKYEVFALYFWVYRSIPFIEQIHVSSRKPKAKLISM